MSKNTTTYEQMLEDMKEMPVIDTHEHLIPEEMRLKEKSDFFNIFLSHYALSDLVSCGMTEDDITLIKDSDEKIETKAGIFMKYWRRTSNTAYCRAIKTAIKDIYDIDAIDESTLPEINSRMAAQNKPGLYKQILQDKLNIQFCVWDQWFIDEPVKDDFFKLSLRLDEIIYINDPKDIKNLENKFHTTINTPSDIEDILEIYLTSYKIKGLVSLKSGLAYERTLYYEPVSQTLARVALEKILRNRFSDEDAKTLQDYLMYSVAEKAFWHNLPFQIHTGLQEGNGNYIHHANPSLLSSLVKHNPNTRFALLHGGFPYGGETAAMAKMFKNVYLDTCWAHIISPEYTKRYLLEWLDTVPVSKILGFGGDYMFVEGIYGHLKIAKENVAYALAEKVDHGEYTMDEAKTYAAKIFHDNAMELFSI